MTQADESLDEPTTPEELQILHRILQSDPKRYLNIVSEWIRANPKNAQAYFSRHFAWMSVGEPQLALEDLNKVIALEPDAVGFLSRGEVYRHVGEYEKAIEDFGRGEAIDPVLWEADAVGLLYQADTHARLGDEPAALACCARLPDDFWTPGLQGAPAGDKTQIADEVRRIAADARRRRG